MSKCKTCHGLGRVDILASQGSQDGFTEPYITDIECINCNGTGEEPEVELMSAGYWHACVATGAKDSLIAFQECQDNARAYQRQVDAQKLMTIVKELQAMIMPEFDDRVIEVLQSVCTKLEEAAQAIESNKGDSHETPNTTTDTTDANS